jgi:hypothetical protein
LAFDSKGLLKPGFHCIGSRVETGCFQAIYGSAGFKQGVQMYRC